MSVQSKFKSDNGAALIFKQVHLRGGGRQKTERLIFPIFPHFLARLFSDFRWNFKYRRNYDVCGAYPFLFLLFFAESFAKDWLFWAGYDTITEVNFKEQK